MGGKKTVEKSREWEKERRDKLNHNFFELSKLLPDHDPSMTLSKKQILTQAAEYIRMLQEQNKQILKEGTDSILRIEAERLKKRVAQLLLKTKLLVDALRTAGVPIPRKINHKQSQNKKRSDCVSHSSNQNKPNGKTEVKVQNTLQESSKKVSKKKVKCGCDKIKIKSHKNPLKEINSTVESTSVVTSTSSVNKTAVSSSSIVSVSYSESKVAEVQKSSSSLLIPISRPGIISGSVVTPGGIQTLAPVLERNILSSLGPGTLILADGRVVSVPPIVPQIVMKPQPAVIVMQNTKKKDKLLIPKRDITKTTFANKAPIPAVKHYRLEAPRTRTTAARSRVKKLKTTIVAPSKGNSQTNQNKKSNKILSIDNTVGFNNPTPEHTEKIALNDKKEREKIAISSSNLQEDVDNNKVQSNKGDPDVVRNTGMKRKHNGAIDIESNKIVKVISDSNTQSVPSEKGLSDVNEHDSNVSDVQSEQTNCNQAEINQLEPPLTIHIDKEDAYKLNHNKYTIDALFNKTEEPQSIAKSADQIEERNDVCDHTLSQPTHRDSSDTSIAESNNCDHDSTLPTPPEPERQAPLEIISPVQSCGPSVVCETNDSDYVGHKEGTVNSTSHNQDKSCFKENGQISLPPTSLPPPPTSLPPPPTSLPPSLSPTSSLSSSLPPSSLSLPPTSRPSLPPSSSLSLPLNSSPSSLPPSSSLSVSPTSSPSSLPPSSSLSLPPTSSLSSSVPHPPSSLPLPTSSVPLPTSVSLPTSSVPLPTSSVPLPTSSVPLPTSSIPLSSSLPYPPTSTLLPPTSKLPPPTSTLPPPTSTQPPPTASLPPTSGLPPAPLLRTSVPSTSLSLTSVHSTSHRPPSSLLPPRSSLPTLTSSFPTTSLPRTCIPPPTSLHRTNSLPPTSIPPPTSLLPPPTSLPLPPTSLPLPPTSLSLPPTSLPLPPSSLPPHSHSHPSSHQPPSLRPLSSIPPPLSSSMPAPLSLPPPQSSSSSQLVSDIINSSATTIAELSTKTTTTFASLAFSSTSDGGSFKTDCILSSVDFLRNKDVQDQRNSFMPIIDDVRLTSEFSNDLFTSLQVPSAMGGQHPESISPTAAFLLAFPLVSTSKNADNQVDNENHDQQHTNTPTTILQIGNIDPPGANELFHSIDYPSKSNKQFLGKDTIDRFHSFELSSEYEANIGSTSDVQKAYRGGSNEKKKDTSHYLTHEECRSKSQRKQCDISLTPDRAKESQNNVVATSGVCSSVNGYQQPQSQQQQQQQQQQQCYGGYPLFSTCNEFSSSVMPPSTSQYSSVGVGTDPKTDVINMLPWTTSNHINQQQDFTSSHTPHLDKETCGIQKNKHTYERKSKSDKITQKSCSYNFNQYNVGNECYGFKQEKKKGKQNQMSRPPVNWMTAPDSRNIIPEPLPHLDIYTPQKEVDTTFPVPPPPPTGVAQNPFSNTFPSIEMSIDGFSEFCSSKKTTNNYCWSPSKCLLPPSVENHGLVIPSTLPTLVGDLALGTNTTSTMDNAYKPFENNRKFDHSIRKLPDKVESVKKRNDFPVKNQASNTSFLSVSQLVDPKCKKQTKHHGQQVDMNKNCGVKRHSGSNIPDKVSVKNLQRTNCNYSTSNPMERKDQRVIEPNCMYSSSKNSLPSNQWNEKQRNAFKGGSYSAESLIGVQHQNINQQQEVVGNSNSLKNVSGASSFHHSNNLTTGTSYQPVQSSTTNYFHTTTDYNVQSTDGSQTQGGQQYNQNCFNFSSQPHFSTGFISEDYQVDSFVGFSAGGTTAQSQQIPAQGHHHHHQQQQQQQQGVVEHSKQKRQVNGNSNTSGGKCGQREDHNGNASRVTNESSYHNNPRLSSSTASFIQPPPPPQVYHPGYSLPPPSKPDISYSSTASCSQHLGLTTNTTTTLTNFNLSTIFPEMNERGPPSSTSHLNASFVNLSSQNYHHHHPPPPPLPH